MREIKFRVWSKAQKRFIPYPWRLETIPNNWSLNSIFEDDEVIFQQFTGYTLQYGKDVYEGDIINTKTNRWIVEYNDDLCQFTVRGLFYSKSFFSLSQIYDGILMGNIFENPELLK